MEKSISESSTTSALEEVYVRNAPGALRLAYFLTGDRELAEDLTQEAFIRVAGRFRYVRDPNDLPAYIRRTIVNLFVSHLRHQRLERNWVRNQARPPLFAHDVVTIHDDLWHAMMRLPERQRVALVLRYYEDLSEIEAARIMRCSVGALNQLVVRAKTALRQQMQGADA